MKNVRLLLSIHRWSGLITGINVLILSLSGAYLVFTDEIIDTFKGPDEAAQMSVAPDSKHSVQSALDAILTREAGGRVAFVFEDAHNSDVLVAGVIGSDQALHKYAYNKKSGAISEPHDSTISKVNLFILRLHANLFAAYKGIVLIGVVAIVFLVSTATGLIIYAPFMKKVLFGQLRVGRGGRRVLSDMHKLVGVTSLGFNVLIAVTGIALTLGNLAVQQWSNAALKEHVAALPPAPAVKPAPPPIDVILANAAKTQPNYHVLSVIYPGAAQGDRCYLCYIAGNGNLSRYVRMSSLVLVETPEKGEVIKMPLWVKLMAVCVPLHFGNFGGAGIKIVYCLFGLTSGILIISGAPITMISWRNKLRARSRRAKSYSPSLSAAQESVE